MLSITKRFVEIRPQLVFSYAVVTMIRLRFDGRSTAYQSLKVTVT